MLSSRTKAVSKLEKNDIWARRLNARSESEWRCAVNVRLEKHREGSSNAAGARRATSSPHSDFALSVANWPEVVACYAMTGEMDYLLRVHVEDMDHFSRFMMQTLLSHPAVADVKSSFALQRIKDTTALPLV
jgi:Lrp/AsnC family transcriptional regulator, leucine-responsive regulatory protein